MKHTAGDVREDGKVFIRYSKTAKNGEYWSTQEVLDGYRQKVAKRAKNRLSTLEGHVKRLWQSRKYAAEKANVPFDITFEEALSLVVTKCPILGVELSWCEQKGKTTESSPSLDKFKPELGYVSGNVFWMSHKANTMKSNATIQEIEALLNWMKAQA